jgi:1-acyl-sn-glycerol-3-phosphate acyltransferase
MPSAGKVDASFGTQRGAVTRALWPVTSYLAIGLASALCCVYFFVLNRTRLRRRHLAIRPNTLVVSNHQSSMDSFLAAWATLHPRCWLEPRLLPWNLAAVEFFFRTPTRAWLADQLRCIPVEPGRRDPVALRRLIAALQDGVAIAYPEGRRSPDGALLPAEPGVGMLVLATRPRVIPVAIDGTRDAVRFERFGLRFFKRIAVSVGEPVDLSEFHGRALSRSAAQGIADRIMDAIEAELAVARAMRVGQKVAPPPPAKKAS